MGTTAPGKGYPIGTPGTGRGNITMHYASYSGSHGCPTIQSPEQWKVIKKLMSSTRSNKKCSNRWKVPVRVQYTTSYKPKGNRENGKSDPSILPVAILR